MQVDVIRPTSVIDSGDASAVPSGTLATVTADDSDSTYIQTQTSDSGLWAVSMGSHTPDAGYERHQIRMRVRARTDAGTAQAYHMLGEGTPDSWSGNIYQFSVTSSFQDLTTDWTDDTVYELETSGALSTLIIDATPPTDPADGATETRTSELYIDIDCRFHPNYDPEIRDAAGTDQAGGTVQDTNQPTLYFGTVAYDGLPSLDWSVTVTGTSGVVFSDSNTGAPPSGVTVTEGLPDGDYTAEFTVRSTIRGGDPFAYSESLTFEVQVTVAPPSPPLLDVEVVDDGYQLTWTYPGGLPWDDDYVIAEVWRDDCTGSQRIATVPDGLNGSYLDLAIPQLDPQPTGPDCEMETEDCDITYRVRYWGYVSDSVEIPETIPVDLILAWPGTVATIPDGWTRVTEMDSHYPRGATSSAEPTIYSGVTSHVHTTPGHTHQISSHSHTVGGSTSGSSTSTTTRRFNGADKALANQSHSHTLPASTGQSGTLTSTSSTPGTNEMTNQPPTYEVIFIKSDGTETGFPPGILGWSVENVSGWTPDAASQGRFLRAAILGGNGGQSYGANFHTHQVLSHDHTMPVHDHSIANSGLSGPQATTEGETGSTNPRWLPRHVHALNSQAATGNTVGFSGLIVTDSSSAIPLNRSLRVLRNTDGGIQTRIIGLYLGAIVDLDPVLTWCNGSNGTPDMRGLFTRDPSTGSVNAVTGMDSHSHQLLNHSHSPSSHVHNILVSVSGTGDFARDTSGDQGNVPTESHTHTADQAGAAHASVVSSGTGTSGLSDTRPPYREAHFVRLDGTVAGGTLPIPELRITEFSSITAPSFTYSDGLDRLSSMTDRMAVVTNRNHVYPRLVAESTPMAGGLPSVSTTEPGEDVTLSIAVVGMPEIDALEALLASDRLYYSPLGGTPGWFAPGGWTVRAPAPTVKVVDVTMVRQPWPTIASPEEFL